MPLVPILLKNMKQTRKRSRKANNYCRCSTAATIRMLALLLSAILHVAVSGAGNSGSTVSGSTVSISLATCDSNTLSQADTDQNGALTLSEYKNLLGTLSNNPDCNIQLAYNQGTLFQNAWNILSCLCPDTLDLSSVSDCCNDEFELSISDELKSRTCGFLGRSVFVECRRTYTEAPPTQATTANELASDPPAAPSRSFVLDESENIANSSSAAPFGRRPPSDSNPPSSTGQDNSHPVWYAPSSSYGDGTFSPEERSITNPEESVVDQSTATQEDTPTSSLDPSTDAEDDEETMSSNTINNMSEETDEAQIKKGFNRSKIVVLLWIFGTGSVIVTTMALCFYFYVVRKKNTRSLIQNRTLENRLDTTTTCCSSNIQKAGDSHGTLAMDISETEESLPHDVDDFENYVREVRSHRKKSSTMLMTELGSGGCHSKAACVLDHSTPTTNKKADGLNNSLSSLVLDAIFEKGKEEDEDAEQEEYDCEDVFVDDK